MPLSSATRVGGARAAGPMPLRSRLPLALVLLVTIAFAASSAVGVAGKVTRLLTEEGGVSGSRLASAPAASTRSSPVDSSPSAITIDELSLLGHSATLGRPGLYEHLNAPNPLIAARAQEQLNCTVCTTLATLIEPYLFENSTQETLVGVATLICIASKPLCHSPDACSQVCLGIVSEYRDEFFELMRLLVTPSSVCVALKQCLAPPPPTPSTDIPVRSDLSDTEGEVPWPSWSLTEGTGTFVHLSDSHIDPFYVVGAQASCPLPVCCHATDVPTLANQSSAAGVWGDYGCDTPSSLAQSLLDHLASLDPQPDFIIFTGDDAGHNVWEQSREENLGRLSLWNSMLEDSLGSAIGIPIFSSLGNHEVYPINQFAGPGLDSWLYDAAVKAWSPNLPADAQRTMAYGGYYQARVRPGLRVISLNSNYFTNDNFWLLANLTDSQNQLNWVADVLSQARARSEKAIVICHAPLLEWNTPLAQAFLDIVEQYSEVVTNYFVGHTHLNSYATLRSSLGVPTHVAFVGGSIVPYTDVNPGFLAFDYDRAQVASQANYKYLAQDARAHWLDLDQANADNSTIADGWTKVRWDMREALSVPELDAASLSSIGPSFATNATLYQAYIFSQYKGVVQSQAEKPAAVACATTSNTAEQFHQCLHNSGFTETDIREKEARAAKNC